MKNNINLVKLVHKITGLSSEFGYKYKTVLSQLSFLERQSENI